MPLYNHRCISATLSLQELQRNYLIIHKALFTFSITKIFPFTLLFGKQNFQRYAALLQTISTELHSLKKIVAQEKQTEKSFLLRDYYIKLDEYMQHLNASILILIKISENLHKRDHAISEFSLKTHNSLIKEYQKEMEAYTAIGQPLNQLYKKVVETEKLVTSNS